jgi:hypothetical protein
LIPRRGRVDPEGVVVRTKDILKNRMDARHRWFHVGEKVDARQNMHA